MLINFALKITFQIPLAASLGKQGFAFPSGHMQTASVFYGWIAWNVQSLLVRLLLIVIILGVGYSLVHFAYHNYYDVLAAFLVAALLLWCYWRASKKEGKKIRLLTIITATSCLLYIFIQTSAIEPHLLLAFYALCGFVIAEKICDQKIQQQLAATPSYAVLAKVLATALCFAVIWVLQWFMQLGFVSALPPWAGQLGWLAVGAVIPSALALAVVGVNHHLRHLRRSHQRCHRQLPQERSNQNDANGPLF